jgi:hypothetical protein
LAKKVRQALKRVKANKGSAGVDGMTAVIVMLTQRKIEEAARAVGSSPATLMEWQKLPEFQKAYREARRAAFGQVVARLQQETRRPPRLC